MAKPYAAEMMKLPGTFEWAAGADVGPLRRAVRSASSHPLLAIGSGGAFTAALALAGLHQRHTCRLGAVATPLEMTEQALDKSIATWLVSAGGSNADIMSAAISLIRSEQCQIGVVCGRPESPLVDLCGEHPFVDVLVYPPPSGRDGFLATNSLFGMVSLFTRAYAEEFESQADWEDVETSVRSLLLEKSTFVDDWRTSTEKLWPRSTILVLHGPSTRIGAVDLESKFTEAALGNVQVADFRNFAHGRHHWLAKRAETSGVLALVSDADRKLAERTLELIPPKIPQARLAIEGGASGAALISLLAALWITGWAGIARGIDPGQPGVPNFGRKLYHLGPRSSKRPAGPANLTSREAASIARKAGADISQLSARRELELWRGALASFHAKLTGAMFAGIVLDYDGTVVDTRLRSNPPGTEMVTQLVRLAESGIKLGIATGRGASARRDLQKCLPRDVWHLVFVGYYNGAEVASLEDDSVPDKSETVCEGLQPVEEAIRQHPTLATCEQDNRPFQITLHAPPHLSVQELWELARQAVVSSGKQCTNVTQSGHSVDLTPAGVSKLSVVARLREFVADAPILSIGDRGRWPGNDHELLGQPFALGVDEINMDPSTCWHLGRPGQRGPIITLEYLLGLELHSGGFGISSASLR